MKALLQLVAIILITILGFLARGYLVRTRPVVPEKQIVEFVPTVEVLAVKAEQRVVEVQAHGVVESPRRFSLAPEVSGRVVFIAEGFQEGASMEAGATLLRIDPRDASLARDAAKAERESSLAALALEQASAEVSIADWRELNQGKPPVLVARTPQIAAAKARLTSAEVALATAELAHSRTTLSMPLGGRIVSRQAQLGQRLDPMSPVAMIEAVSGLEVRLSLELAQLGLLELEPDGTGAEGLEIVLEADLGGTRKRWKALGKRTAANLSPSNPVVTLIATIEAPEDGSALPVSGLFVRAIIRGRSALLTQIPRQCIDLDDRVMIVDSESRLYHRKLSVLQRTPEFALIESGLQEGESLVIRAPAFVLEGMRVRLVEGDSSTGEEQAR